MYFNPLFAQLSINTDIRILKAQSDEGNAEAKFFLGALYYTGKAVEQDFSEAIKLFEEYNVLNRIELGGKRARYEELNEDEHHDHLIDIDSGEIIEFVNEEIEKLQMKVAKKLGYELVDHRMELFGKKILKKN